MRACWRCHRDVTLRESWEDGVRLIWCRECYYADKREHKLLGEKTAPWRKLNPLPPVGFLFVLSIGENPVKSPEIRSDWAKNDPRVTVCLK